MKKIKLTLALSALTIISVAQPYGETRYTHSTAITRSGVNAIVSGNPGFLLAGNKDTSTTSSVFYVDRTDAGGVINASTWVFQEAYQITGNTDCTTPTTNQIYRCGAVQAIEINNTQTPYAVAGAVPHGLFFCLLNANGTPASSWHYDLPGAAYQPSKHVMIFESSSTGNFIICVGTPNNEMYILKISPPGALLASYNINVNGGIIPYAMIESPYNGDITIVGLHNNSGNWDGFFFQIDQAFTAVTVFDKYDDGGATEYFSSINVASSTNPTSSGFIIGGSYANSTAGVATSPLLLKVGQTGGTPIWQEYITGSFDANADGITGVFERLGTSPATYQYYAVTSSSVGMVVYRVDASGAPFNTPNPGTQDEYLYDIAGNAPTSAIGITHKATGAADQGIHVYGYDEGDFYFVEAFYSGQSGCESRTFINSNTLTNLARATISGIPITAPTTCSNFNITSSSNSTFNQQCGPYTGAGNNNKTITGIIESSSFPELRISPNPGRDVITLNFSGVLTVLRDARIYDIAGKLLEIIDWTDVGNKLTHILNISKLGLVPGIYFIDVTTEGSVLRQKLVFID
jgi:hypothetical protein